MNTRLATPAHLQTLSGPDGTILMAHGGGGQLTDTLVEQSILPRLQNLALSDLLDSGLVEHAGAQLAVSIDSYVVQPLFFPGGDIGRLAVSGTVNDLSVCGARPLGLCLSLILTEGLDRSILDRVLDSVAATAREAGVQVVTGDTKVVGRAQGDGIFITTSGVGAVRSDRPLHPRRIQPGDVILINGPIADHGLAVMLAREMPDVQSVLRSDAAPLNGLIHHLLDKVDGVTFMRDPTRGGLASVAADIAARSSFHVTLDETVIPVRPETRHAADMLGLDPLEVANEGKVVIVVREPTADAALAALREHPLGRHACAIGRIESAADGLCEIRTAIGGRRIVQKPYGEQLPRIC